MEHLQTLSQDSLLHFPPLSPPLWKKLVWPSRNEQNAFNKSRYNHAPKPQLLHRARSPSALNDGSSVACGSHRCWTAGSGHKKKKRISLSTNSVLKLFHGPLRALWKDAKMNWPICSAPGRHRDAWPIAARWSCLFYKPARGTSLPDMFLVFISPPIAGSATRKMQSRLIMQGDILDRPWDEVLLCIN